LRRSGRGNPSRGRPRRGQAATDNKPQILLFRPGGRREHGSGAEVRSHFATAVYVLSLIAAILAVDLLFFRHQFWERLTMNIGVALVFSAFYFRFEKRP
jgi:hypothetical protein